MKNKMLLLLLVGAWHSHALVNPTPGENLWHLVAGVGTGVDELAVSSAACCAATFTVLDAMEATLSNKIATVDAKLDALSASQLDSFVGTFSVLNEISEDLLATMTQIAALAQSVESNLSTIDGLLTTQFAALDSKLDGCCYTINSNIDSLNSTINSDFAGTYTVLTTIINQEQTTASKLDRCCYTISSNIDSLSILAAASFAGTFTTLNTIFNEEKTIESKIDGCCYTLGSKIDSLNAIVTTDFAGTFTAIAAINCSGSTSACAPTAITGGTVIATSGTYCMSSNITGNITISASEVTIDLNGFALIGGITINNSASSVVIENGSITPPAPTASNTYAITIASGSYIRIQNCNILCLLQPATTGINGCGGISNSGTNIIIENSFIQAGPGASGSSVSTGGIGILNANSNVIITNNTINGGADSSGGAGGDAINAGSSSRMLITNNILTAGAGSSSISGGVGGVGVNNLGSDSQVLDCVINPANGGAGGFGPGGKAGNGIVISLGASNALIKNCKIKTGVGGAGSSGVGGAGGVGILDQGTLSFITLCEIVAGNGGTGTTGGAGGYGIVEASATKNQIVECFIQQTGAGGTGGTVAGGDGILISLSDFIEISLCSIANTGAGNPNTNGGLAINDYAGGGTKAYYSNFAFNIANPTKYVLGSGGLTANGVPFAAGTDRLQNVYKP